MTTRRLPKLRYFGCGKMLANVLIMLKPFDEAAVA